MTSAAGPPTAAKVAIATPLRAATVAGQAAASASAGGNAVDAALAAAGVLTVAYPHNCALGGDLLALVREPDGTTTFVNASGPAPAAADVETLRARYETMPLLDPATVTVPGLVGGWAALHRHGAALSWSDLLQPAVDAAADGIPVSPGLAGSIAEAVTDGTTNRDWLDVFAPDGSPLTLGQTLRQPALTRTLRQLSSLGADTWYGGDLGRRLVTGLVERGVPMTLDDLSAFRVLETAPLTLSVGDWQVQTAPPNSQGFLLLRLLGALDRTSTDATSPVMHRHPLATTARLFMQALRDRVTLLADPASMRVDVSSLLTDSELVRFFDDAQVLTPAGGAPRDRPNGDTVAVVAVDSDGRSVSLIQSLYYSFGSMILEPDTGVLMHNRGSNFSLDPDSPNVFAAGKRPAHTLTPLLAQRGSVHAAIGTMGGEMQPQILTQVLSNLFAGASPQDAVSAARWTVGPWDRGDGDDLLSFEADLAADITEQIRDWPGPQRSLPARSSETGHSQIAISEPTGLASGTDPRADGLPTASREDAR